MQYTDVHQIPLFYIAFSRNPEIERHYFSHGFTDVNFFPAIDGRKLDPIALRKNNIISIRSFDDLLSARTGHSGIPSLGAIGCYLSHRELWKLCVQKRLPYIIITEEDNRQLRKLSLEDKKNILNAITKPRGIFVSTHISHEGHRIHFFGTNFYVISFSACQMALENSLPIDVQVDWYLSHLATMKKLDLTGYNVSRQLIHDSTIQDNLVFSKKSYVLWVVVTLVLVCLIFFLLFKKKCPA